jgi:hypothetical protein
MKHKLTPPYFSAAFAAMVLTGTASAAVTFNANVTPNVIFGSGNANGGYTVDQNNDIELGLRGKLRHDATGQPQNIFNSNGNGTYSFATGQAFGQSANTGVWSIEFSINSSFSGTGLDLTNPLVSYLLEIDSDPSMGTSFAAYNPLAIFSDNAFGDNTTANGGGTAKAAPGTGDFVAQNSQKGVWLIPGYNPNLDGTYDFKLSAFDAQGSQLASTQIQVIAGAGGASVPDGGSMAVMLGGSLLGLAGFRRFLSRKG